MILYHLQNRHSKNTFFRENRESFFANVNASNGVNIAGVDAENKKNQEKQKTRAERKEELKERRLNERRKKIEKLLKKVKNKDDLSLLENSEIKNILKLTDSQNSEIFDILNGKGFQKSEISDFLEKIEQEEESQVRDFFSWSVNHGNHALRKQDQILLTKISPEIFLTKYVKGYKANRKRYFSALGKLNRKRTETLNFAETLTSKKIKKISSEMSLSSQEQDVLLALHQETLEAQTHGIFRLFSKTQKENIQAAKHSAFEKSQEFSSQEELLEENAQNKEAEMLKIVQKSLGKKVSQEISGKMRRGENNKQKRIQIFFEELAKHSQNKISHLKKLESEELIGAVNDSRKFYLSLIHLADFSSSEKKEAFGDMNKVYDVFSDFFSGKQNTDFANFYFKNKALSEAEKNDIDLIETVKSEIQTELFLMHKEYSDLISTLNNADRNDVINSEFFESLYKKYGVNIKRLKAFAKNGEPLEASHFPHISKKLHEIGFSATSTINDLVENPENIHNAVDKKVIEHWFKKSGGAESSGFLSLSKTPSKKIISFYGSSPTQKKEKMLQKFFSIERKIGGKLVHSRKLSGVSLDDDLRNEYSEKLSPTFIKEQFAQVKKELGDTFGILNGEEYPEARSLQNFLRKEIARVPNPSIEEIQKNNIEFSGKLAELLKQGADKNIILEGLEDFGAENYIEYLQDQKNQFLRQKEEGTLKYFLKNKLTKQARKELQDITNSVASLKNPEKIVSPQEQNFLNFIEKFTPLSQKISEGNFTLQDLPNFLDIKNTNGESLVIPLSRTDKPIEKFESESDSGIIFDPKSGHIIVSDELYRNMQEFPEISHIRMLSHEVGHLWANKSNLEKNARKLLKQNNLLDFVEQKFLEIFPKKTGIRNDIHAVEEVFSELLSANQFGLENFAEPEFFQKNLGLGDKMSELLKGVVLRLGVENIQKILQNSESEFLQNIATEKNDIKNKISVGEAGLGLSSKEADKQFKDQIDESCETHQVEKKDDSIDNSGRVDLNKLKRMQADAEREKANIENIFNDIEQYKSQLPHYSSDIDSFLEKHRQFLQEDLEDLNNRSLANNSVDEIITHINKIKDNTVGFSGQLAQALDPDDNYFQSLWANTSLLSMNDIKEMWGTAFESIKRRLDTKAKKRRGAAGESIFSGIWDGLANEYGKDVESAEKTEVGEIQEALENKQTPDIYDFLGKTTNEDEVKAALQALSGRGMIDWDREEVHKALHRAGSGIQFYDSDFDNPDVRNRKYKKAFTRVWGDEEMFMEMFNENDGNVQSQIKKYGEEAANNVGMSANVKEMIKDHRNGVFIDPNRYEGYVKQMVVDGKGAPADPFFYLMYGVANGIIPIQSFNRLDDLQNTYSITNFLADNDWTKSDIQGFVREILWDSKLGKHRKPEDLDPNMLDHWMYKNVFTDTAVYERTNTNVSQKNFDHDHGRLLYSVGSSESAASLLTTKSTGALEVKQTTYPNAVAGMLGHISSLALQQDDMDSEVLRNTVLRQAGFFSTFDFLSTGKNDAKAERFFTFSPANYNEKPREGRYNPDMTTRDFIEAQRDIYSSVHSPDLKKFLEEAVFSSELSKDFKNLPRALEQFTKEDYPRIHEALDNAGVSLEKVTNNGKNSDFMKQLIPALFEYYLNPPKNSRLSSEEADKNLNSILAKTRSVSSGSCNPKWANAGDPSMKDVPNPPNKISIPDSKRATNVEFKDLWK